MRFLRIPVLVAAIALLPMSGMFAKADWAKKDAKKFINKTALLILHAQKVVKEGKVYKGNLAKAIAHQNYAKKLYKNGNFLRAVYQSHVARQFAALAIVNNKKKVPDNLQTTKQEGKDLGPLPTQETLVQEMEADSPGQTYDDSVQVSLEIDLEIKD